MVLTRSKDGEQTRQRQEELSVGKPAEEKARSDSASTSNAVTDTSGTSSGTSGSTGTEATTSSGTRASGAASHNDQISQRTLKPADARSSRSVTSRKKLLAELEAKERLAELKLKQAKLQAETEIQELRIQRLQAEADASEEEDEETEDELTSVRINTWLKDTDADQTQPFNKETRQEEAKKQKEDDDDSKKKKEDASKSSQPLIDVSTLAAALSQAVRSTREPPKYIQELPLFNGTSAEWLGFKAAFEETFVYFTRNENIARIRRSLRGTAKEAVGCLLLSQPDPRVIIEALERRFGRPEALIHVEMEKLKSLNKVTDNPRDLCIFAGKVANIVGTIEALKKPQYLHSPEMARTVIEKLTPIMKNKWYDYAAMKTEDTPDLKKMSMFLNEEADKCGAYALPEVVNDEAWGRERRPRKVERTFATGKKMTSDDQCPQCKQDHKLTECKQYFALDTNARWEVAKKNNICYRCLRSRHRRLLCKAPPCGRHGCIMRHHKLLHHDKEPSSTSDEAEKRETAMPAVEVTSAAKPGGHRRAYLKIAPVILKGPHASIETYALLDEGSTVTLLDASIADVIGVDGPSNTMWIQGVGNEMKHDNSKVINLSIKGKYADEEYKIEAARTVDRLSFTPETVQGRHIEGCEHLIDIQDQITYQRASPKLLIGQDNWHLIVSRELRTGRRNQPVASLTQLGWVLHGCHSSLTAKVAFCGRLQQKEDEPSLEELVKNHFKLESLCIEPRRPREDPEQKAIQILEETSRRLPEGRFETGLLWKEKELKIPNNYKEAERRLHSLEKRLDKDEDLKKKYEERMDNLFQSGYAEKAPTPAPAGKTWYLPHFPVINPAKPHKPPRLVHDASARAAGMSLNDMLHSGPDLLQSLPGVIMRFRQHAYAVSGDIKEMFMQIKIRNEDRDALRFIWRGNRREGQPTEYRMTSVIFGATSSPCTALFIKDKNARDFATDYPEAAAAIQKNHYMDDYLQSFSSVQEARKITREVDDIHKKAGFVLNGWTSNETKTIEGLGPIEDAATVNLGGKDTEKTLGLIWHVKEDCIGFNTGTMKIPAEVEESKRTPTKREALSIIMALFDPLGLISPVTTPAKRIFQDTWRFKTDWDEPLPAELEDRWNKWITSLNVIKQLRVPRCYDYQHSVSCQLHTFVDSSEEAYAAAVYWRTVRIDGSVHVALAAAKSRVTPLKPISMPRLELQAALLGARLAQTVIEEHDFQPTSKTYWSDSRTALVWIRSEPRVYKSFVAHRLAEIEETTKKDEWRWLPSRDNVADDATRDTPDNFSAAHRWFHGPSFLRLPETQWPKEDSVVKYDTGEEREKCNSCQQEERNDPAYLPKINRFSKWLRLIRATARVLQFVDLCRPNKSTVVAARKRTKKTETKDPDWRTIQVKKPPPKQVRKIPSATRHYLEISATYLLRAEQLWVRASQRESYNAEIDRMKKEGTPDSNDRLSHLSVYLDTQGTIRLRGRVTAAHEITEDTSNPPILDGKHMYTKLYIAYVHEKLHHGGVEMVVNELRQRLWISKIRPAVRHVIKSCLQCRIRKMKPASPSTGNLPSARLAHHARPFTFTGLDYFGPIEVTVARHREKRYGALFTCMTSRAIHIEVVHSLSADSAVSALRRFMSRRGCPKEIWSDNATCFKAADKELGEAALEALQHETTCHRIVWRYIPPSAPFMGGAWERMVRSVKEALKITLNERYPSDETLVTLLTEVENTVNSRPLTHVSVDPAEPEALTPNHILIGPNPHVPVPGHFTEQDMSARQQWKRAQVLADVFWRRWVKEYMPLLQHRREPTSTGVQPKVGDLVIICDSNLPRNIWPRGRVSQLYPGADGEVRVVDVTTSSGHILRRPTRKIVVLPTESQRGDGGRMCTTP